MRTHVVEYQRNFYKLMTADHTTYQDLLGKMDTLLVYDFEAAISLVQFDDLKDILQAAKPYNDELIYKAMGDILLQSSIPAEGTAPDPYSPSVQTNNSSPGHYSKTNHKRNPLPRTIQRCQTL